MAVRVAALCTTAVAAPTAPAGAIRKGWPGRAQRNPVGTISRFSATGPPNGVTSRTRSGTSRVACRSTRPQGRERGAAQTGDRGSTPSARSGAREDRGHGGAPQGSRAPRPRRVAAQNPTGISRPTGRPAFRLALEPLRDAPRRTGASLSRGRGHEGKCRPHYWS